MRIVRNLDHKLPSRYMDSFGEWIPEGVEELRTPFTLDTKSTPNMGVDGEFWTHNHVVKLPCGLVEVISVEDQFGYRIHRTGQQMDIEDMSPNRTQLTASNDDARVTDFYTDVLPPNTPGVTIGNQPAIPWTGSNIIPNTSSVTCPFYDLKMDYLQTSDECMFVKIHYKAMPVDKEGYPLIPNVPEFKEALYWYVMKKLIAAGYQHPVLPSSMEGIEYCEKKYETYAGRALGEIKMPDQDRMIKLYNSTVRLIPAVNFQDDFFTGSSEVQPVKYV